MLSDREHGETVGLLLCVIDRRRRVTAVVGLYDLAISPHVILALQADYAAA